MADAPQKRKKIASAGGDGATASSRSKKRKSGELEFFQDKKLGKGAFGTVYEGKFEGKQVAVKRVLLDDWKENERNLLENISHPYLVKYIAFQENPDFMHIVMEFCACTLKDVVAKTYKGLDPGPMEGLLHHTSVGLSFLHSKNIIHRDIKPRNILISRGDKPVAKLADFGLCKMKKDNKSYFTKSADMIGSLGWAAPECASEETKKINYSADVFGLGCVMGYALTGGSHPFGDGSYEELARNRAIGNIVWQKEEVIANEEMRVMIRQMISNDPEKRPPLSEVVGLLRRALPSESSERLVLELCEMLNPDLEDELLEELQLFVDQQLSLNFTDGKGRNPLMIVCEKKIEGDSERAKRTRAMQSKCIRILLSDDASSLIDIKRKDQWGRNALHLLCESYKGEDVVEIAALLIRRGVDVNEKGYRDLTALHYVCWSNNETKTQELVKLLLEHGANVDSRTIGGMTPLHSLTGEYRGHYICDVMRVLLDAGADVNAKDNDGRNALHLLYFANSGHAMLKEAIVLLIEKGIVNEKTKNGNDAIYWLTDREPPNVDELVRLIELAPITAELPTHF